MTTETVITASRNPRWSVLTDKDDFSGCFGILRLRSSSSSLRSQKNNHDDYMPAPRSVPRSNPVDWDPTPPAGSDLKGYSIASKSAEILGLMPKGAPATPVSRTSSPVPWRSLSGNDVSSLRSEVKASSLRSEKSSSSSLSMRRWPVPLADSDNIVTPADPLDAVRRRLREESATSTARSSSAPAIARNYSRKWRKSQRLEVKEIERSSKRDSKASRISKESTKDFLDAASSVGTPIKEDEIPDTNKFDKLLTPTRNDDVASISPSQRSSTRIRSAAFTTFAWMELQANMGVAAPSEANRSSWLLVDEKLPSPTANTANESKKRSAHISRASVDSDTLGNRNDKRDTLEWMGVKPADFPVPLVSSVVA